MIHSHRLALFTTSQEAEDMVYRKHQIMFMNLHVLLSYAYIILLLLQYIGKLVNYETIKNIESRPAFDAIHAARLVGF